MKLFQDFLINNIPVIDKAQVLQKTACAVLVMMGSNHGRTENFAIAYQMLSSLGECQYSAKIASQDYTGKSFDYDNQAVLIVLTHSMSLADVREFLKSIELKVGRNHNVDNTNTDNINADNIKCTVPLDLDILAFCEYADDNTQQLWQGVKERFPLKAHEIAVLSA
ncbi:MAG: 2-amino-4-hydroxy-6-hydroxymethyldihydropteridine diphosphokinase [Moraxella sp.]|nr:2-amino-4-hydroxy-6-hydroxymethyldihydropteridine diphosphokinase [Moraxella sp.]